MLKSYKKEGKLLIGAKQTLRNLNDNNVIEVFIAKDSEKHVVRNIEEIAKEKQIKITYVDSMKKLGKDCGISVGATTAAIIK